MLNLKRNGSAIELVFPFLFYYLFYNSYLHRLI